MTILLDTQVVIWMVEADPKLGQHGRAIIETARSNTDALVSPISSWEASMLVSKGRLGLGMPVAELFEQVLATPGFRMAGFTIGIGVDAGGLPGAIHGDPADRLIVATARSYGCPVLTADRKILTYAKAGHVQAIDARR